MRTYHLVLVLALLGADATPPPPAGGTVTGSVVAVKGQDTVPRVDVYVYLEPVGRPRRGALPGAGQKAQIVQKGEEFLPRVIVVPTGTTVWFPNLTRNTDGHNVFSPTDPVFDLGNYRYDPKGKAQKFDDPDEYDIFCDIHPRMWAKIKVVDTPYIAHVVNGKFTITGVAPGKYKAVAWVRNSPESKSEVITVEAGKTTPLSRELHLQIKTRSGCHDRKDGTKYSSKYSGQCPEDY